MGGRALKNTLTRRMTPEEFQKVGELVVEEFKRFSGGDPFAKNTYVSVVPSYFKKESHGDIDILYSNSLVLTTLGERLTQWKRIIEEKFFCREWVKNSEVFSFEFRFSEEQKEGFQIDLISLGNATKEDFDFALKYFSFNDLGNLIGRVSHKMGLKFGHDGLQYVFRDLTNASYVVDTLEVSTDFIKTLAFLGYDPDRYLEGFETLEDIYQYAASGKFFNPEIFLLENRNYKARVRDAKRPTYTGFLAWCEKEFGKEKGRDDVFFQFPEDKKFWLPRTFKWFPSFAKSYELTRIQAEKDAKRKQKFNGKLVREWTGLDGMALGQFMKHLLTNSFFYPEYLDDCSFEDIEREVRSLYNEYIHDLSLKVLS